MNKPFFQLRSVQLTGLILFLSSSLSAQTSPSTSIHGQVLDSLSGESLPYASVQIEGEEIGTRTDIDGYFFFESKKPVTRIRITYVGYKTRVIPIKANTANDIKVRMAEETYGIKEITIKPKKYRKKNNPAIDLVEQVFKHKDENRKEGLDYYSYEKYEKLQFDLNNINDKFRKQWYLRKFRFIFDNVDTNKVNGKVALPFYLRERLIDTYYRKSPQAKKEYLLGERQTSLKENYNLDKNGISAFLSNLYQDVDIYEPNISLLSLQFIGPLSGVAPAFYRFYITDTLEVGGEKFADVFFAPKNKNDLAFMGNMLVALDSTYAVRKVVMGISRQINLNWVTDLRLEQEYGFFGSGANRRLLLTTDAVTMDFNILKNASGRSLQAHKTVSYKNYVLNQPIPDSLFTGTQDLITLKNQLAPREWPLRRHGPLSKPEATIELMMDSIQQVPAFKTFTLLSSLISTGYYKMNGVELGPLATYYSFNDIEGNRFRFGGRTNVKLEPSLLASAYLAYGQRDREWKGSAAVTWAFNQQVPRIFPMNQITAGFQKDIRAPGVDVTNWSPDNLFLSFQRAASNRMLYQNIARLEYSREYRSGFSFFPAFYWKQFSPAGKLTFEYELPDDGQIVSKADITTSEFAIQLRFAPNEKFYQGSSYRYAMLTKSPVYTLSYKAGVKGVWGSEFNYHKVMFNFTKNIFEGPIGRSQVILEAGRTFGKVPYPLLDIHRANQSYEFDWYSYNLMNFMEFVSDKYVSLNIQHNFNGFFLNKVPLVKKLKLREVGSFKLLYGGLDAHNRPSAENGLLLFPVDDNGQVYSHTLEKKPYMEASVGIANIFKLLRIDYLWRLSYTDLPNVDKWGIRFSFQANF